MRSNKSLVGMGAGLRVRGAAGNTCEFASAAASTAASTGVGTVCAADAAGGCVVDVVDTVGEEAMVNGAVNCARNMPLIQSK